MKKLKFGYMEIGLWASLSVQFALIALCNLTLIDKNLDVDNAKLFLHIMEIGKQKTLFLPEWSYMTTLELDCGSLFAIPLYVITRDIFASYGMSNIILTGLFVAMLFFLFKGQNRLYPLMCANLICIPYGLGMLDYFNMMFFAGSQYVIKVMVPLILIGLILEAERGLSLPHREKISLCWIFFVTLYTSFLFVCCMSSGVYVVACGIIPVLGVYIVYKFFKAERISVSVIIVMALSVLCFLVGNYINGVITGGAKGNGMVFTNVYSLLTNVASCFFGMFELFGGVTSSTELPIFSFNGILIIAKICFVLIMLVCSVCNFKKAREGKDLQILLLLAVFFWNYFVLNVANVRYGSPTFEYRYHLMGMLPLICVTSKTLVDGVLLLKKWQQNIVYVFGIFALIFVTGASFKAVLFNGEQNADLKELCGYLEDQDLDYAYMYYGNSDAEICRVLDENTLYLHVNDDARTWVFDYYSDYIDAPIETDNAVVVIMNADCNGSDSFQLADYTLQKIVEVAGRSIYSFTN